MANDDAQAMTDAPGAKKGRLKSILLVVLLMGGEGVGVFLLAKFMLASEPSPASGAHVDAVAPAGAHGEPAAQGHGGKESATPAGQHAEIELTECRPSNRMTGKLITLKIRVSALVASADAERAKTLVEANKARINDRVNFVLRSAEPQHLNEPGLETIKRRLKHELSRVLGDEQLLQEVLIPELLQSGSGL